MTENQQRVQNLKIILSNLQYEYDSLEFSHKGSASADRYFLNIEIQNMKNKIKELELINE
jgi:coenzyme F420-reducing hydrogenase delta subunit